MPRGISAAPPAAIAKSAAPPGARAAVARVTRAQRPYGRGGVVKSTADGFPGGGGIGVGHIPAGAAGGGGSPGDPTPPTGPSGRVAAQVKLWAKTKGIALPHPSGVRGLTAQESRLAKAIAYELERTLAKGEGIQVRQPAWIEPPMDARLIRINLHEVFTVPGFLAPTNPLINDLDASLDLISTTSPTTESQYTVPRGCKATFVGLVVNAVRPTILPAQVLDVWGNNTCVWQIRRNGKPMEGFRRVNHPWGNSLGYDFQGATVGGAAPVGATQRADFARIVFPVLEQGERISFGGLDLSFSPGPPLNTAATQFPPGLVFDIFMWGWEWTPVQYAPRSAKGAVGR